MLGFSDHTGDDLEIEPAHHRIEVSVETGSCLRICQEGKLVSGAEQLTGVQNDASLTEVPPLELTNRGFESALSIDVINDDAAEDKHWIVWVDLLEVVVAGFIEVEDLQLRGLSTSAARPKTPHRIPNSKHFVTKRKYLLYFCGWKAGSDGG